MVDVVAVLLADHPHMAARAVMIAKQSGPCNHNMSRLDQRLIFSSDGSGHARDEPWDCKAWLARKQADNVCLQSGCVAPGFTCYAKAHDFRSVNVFTKTKNKYVCVGIPPTPPQNCLSM